jgi:hypothetical protein
MNRAKAYIHKLREAAGIDECYQEFGFPAKFVDADYRPRNRTISVRNVIVAEFLTNEANVSAGHTSWLQVPLETALSVVPGFTYEQFINGWANFIGKDEEM